MTSAEKVREDRLRRMARRQKLTLRKSGRRDPRAWDYGRYWLVDESNREVGPPQGLDLDGIERFLTD